jgi:hypothetical protein
MQRVICWFGILLGLGMVSYAGYQLVPVKQPVYADEDIIFEADDLGEVYSQQNTPVLVRIRNQSAHPIRIVSGPTGCQKGGCLETVTTCPVEVLPNQAVEIELSLRTYIVEKPLELEAFFYVDVGGKGVQRTVRLTGFGIMGSDSYFHDRP